MEPRDVLLRTPTPTRHDTCHRRPLDTATLQRHPGAFRQRGLGRVRRGGRGPKPLRNPIHTNKSVAEGRRFRSEQESRQGEAYNIIGAREFGLQHQRKERARATLTHSGLFPITTHRHHAATLVPVTPHRTTTAARAEAAITAINRLLPLSSDSNQQQE